jgi:hypothetical protein
MPPPRLFPKMVRDEGRDYDHNKDQQAIKAQLFQGFG